MFHGLACLVFALQGHNRLKPDTIWQLRCPAWVCSVLGVLLALVLHPRFLCWRTAFVARPVLRFELK
jgi:hypothetical protein